MSKPEVDSPENREKQRRKEGAVPLNDAEKTKLIEHLKAVHKMVPIEELAKLFNIPWYRQHQILQCLKGENFVKTLYYKGEWFIECQGEKRDQK